MTKLPAGDSHDDDDDDHDEEGDGPEMNARLALRVCKLFKTDRLIDKKSPFASPTQPVG